LNGTVCVKGCPKNCFTCSNLTSCTKCNSGYTTFISNTSVLCAVADLALKEDPQFASAVDLDSTLTEEHAEAARSDAQAVQRTDARPVCKAFT
jgi:hypothetical protein